MSLMEMMSAILLDDPSRSPDDFCMPWAMPEPDRCEYVQAHLDLCGERTALIPYMQIHYCWFGHRTFISHTLQFTWIFALLLMLMVVTQRFFCPALEVISEFMRLPANVAGATLLSFGNGAPDFFTQLAAVTHMDASSVPIALGEPIGAGLFVTNVVLAFVVFIGGHGDPVPVEKRAFLRDVGFYSGGTILVYFIAADKQITLVEALMMVGYYALFVAYIAVFETSPPEEPTLDLVNSSLDAADSDVTAATGNETVSFPLLLETDTIDATPGATDSVAVLPSRGSSAMLASLQAPLHSVARLTMPEVGCGDESYYPKVYAVLLPLTAPLFVVFVQKLGNAPLNADALIYGAACSSFASLVIAALYPADGYHRGMLTGLFTAMAFCMSVLWMSFLSGEMVRAWKVLGYIHGVSQRMLGVTVLAWINSAPDFIADVSVAHAGKPSMAVAAAFASPLFTLIGGLGTAFLIAVLINGPLHFDPGFPLQVALVFALVSVIRHLALVPLLHRWQLTRPAAAGMLAFYLCFQAVYLWLVAYEPK